MLSGRPNDEMDTQERLAAARADLIDRVAQDDPKAPLLHHLGRLLRYGSYALTTNEYREESQERVCAVLFRRVVYEC